MNKENEAGAQKLSQKTWFIILLLIVFFPVGLYLMWRSSWNRIVKIVLTIIIAVGVINYVITPMPTTAPATTEIIETEETAKEQQVSNPLMAYAINKADVKNGGGTETIGTWANIKINKGDFKNSGQENFMDFIDSKVEGSGYNWFTFVFEDGTGLQFNGSHKQIGVYGELDDEGRVTEVIGNIVLKSNDTYEYAVAESSAEETANIETTAESNTIPTEYKSALKKAKRYNGTMYMSKSGIYQQLTSEYGEQFSAEAAQYAVDNLVADWNANALEKAKSYSESMHMSKMGTYDQLTSEYGEQFTPEEAQYAVDHVDADWKANALEKAKSYQKMDMSLKAIRDQLTSEYGEKFTQEEADYAVANLN